MAFASVGAAQGLPVKSGAPVSRTGSGASSGFVYSDFASEQFQARKAANQNAARPLAGKPLDCQQHVVGDFAEEISLVVGDHLTVDFDMCTYDTDIVVNDVISVTVTQVDGESFVPSPYEVRLDASLVDLKVTNEGSDHVANGVVNIVISDSGSGLTNTEFTGSSLSVDMGVVYCVTHLT